MWHHPLCSYTFLVTWTLWRQGPCLTHFMFQHLSQCLARRGCSMNEWIQWNLLILIIKHSLLTYLLFDYLLVDLFTTRLFRRKKLSSYTIFLYLQSSCPLLWDNSLTVYLVHSSIPRTCPMTWYIVDAQQGCLQWMNWLSNGSCIKLMLLSSLSLNYPSKL